MRSLICSVQHIKNHNSNARYYLMCLNVFYSGTFVHSTATIDLYKHVQFEPFTNVSVYTSQNRRSCVVIRYAFCYTVGLVIFDSNPRSRTNFTSIFYNYNCLNNVLKCMINRQYLVNILRIFSWNKAVTSCKNVINKSDQLSKI